MIANEKSREAVDALVKHLGGTEAVRACLDGIYQLGYTDGILSILSLESRRAKFNEERKAA